MCKPNKLCLTLQYQWFVTNQRPLQTGKIPTITEGGLTSTVVDLRIILQTALVANATSIIATHNHPSGVKRPSIQDDMLTIKIAEACKAVELRLLDHIIVTPEDGYYSYCDEGKL